MTVEYYLYVHAGDRVCLAGHGQALTVPAAAAAVIEALPGVEPIGAPAYGDIHPGQPERYHRVIRAYRLAGNTRVGPWTGHPWHPGRL